ncbi:CGNR zinc finger domain-containing protein [Pseudonocardia sp. ICBG1293]|uniref:CGNR zinc finger domain-containing protein n=1 Tax=Pseudonocardia sp. ICBG1293 TaxID=2844382 RepID=UPI001CCB151D|nr:CGNR zinc finger domain-containing protein [Pseudonocardia sp. ICBG1293]
MLDACYASTRIATAVDLANSLRPVRGEDDLETLPQLRAFLADHPTAGGPDVPHPLTDADLTEVRAVRETVRTVLETAARDAHAAAEVVNDGLRRHRVTPVVRHDGGRWRADLTADSDRPASHLAALTLGALAAVLTTLGPGRLGVCAGPACRATFADLSRNGSKQYCTRTCAHRASVAAYRRRRRPDR